MVLELFASVNVPFLGYIYKNENVNKNVRTGIKMYFLWFRIKPVTGLQFSVLHLMDEQMNLGVSGLVLTILIYSSLKFISALYVFDHVAVTIRGEEEVSWLCESLSLYMHTYVYMP